MNTRPELANDLAGAWMNKVGELRAQGELAEAIGLCTRVITLNGVNARAWQARAACLMQLAAYWPDRTEAARLMALARADRRRAIELEPENEQGTLNLVEADLCDGQAQAAFDLAGTLWRRLKVPHNRVICAWLGALSALAAGVPHARSTEYQTLLAARETALSPTAWGLVEVEQWLTRLRADRRFDRGALASIEEIHRLFLAHFGEAGPAIR